MMNKEFRVKPTLQDVATHASVSVSTASMVLSGKGRIGSETKKRVIESAQLLGYIAPSKKNSRNNHAETQVVGILFNIDYEWAFIWGFIQPIIYEIEKNLSGKSYSVIIIPITHEMNEAEIIQKIEHAHAQAVIAMHFGNEKLFRLLEQADIPVVLVMNNNFQDQFYSVCVDDYQGAYEGTRHLIQLNHRNIAYIDTERPDLPQLIIDRYIGFKKAIDEYHLPFNPDYHISLVPKNVHMFKNDLEKLMANHPAPTAIFCLDDELAAHVIVHLQDAGISVPEDISIIAPGDVLDYSLVYVPQITTMKINTTLMGRIAADMVLSRIKHSEKDIHVLKVKQQLEIRHSCRALTLTEPVS